MEPLQGGAGITQVRAHGHHWDGKTLYTCLLGLSLGTGSGWPMEEDVPGISGTDIQKLQVLGNVASDEGLVVGIKAGRGVLGFLPGADFGNQSSICPS